MVAKKGPLNTRIDPRHLPAFAGDEELAKLIDRWSREDYEKLLLLCDDLNIADGPARFYQLSLALARKHYTGFQQLQPASKWTVLVRAYLVVEIESLVANGLSAKKAAAVLAGRSEWKEFLKSTDNGAEGLRVQYQRFKNDRFADDMRDAHRLHVHNGTLLEWHQRLLDALKNPHPPAIKL